MNIVFMIILTSYSWITWPYTRCAGRESGENEYSHTSMVQLSIKMGELPGGESSGEMKWVIGASMLGNAICWNSISGWMSRTGEVHDVAAIWLSWIWITWSSVLQQLSWCVLPQQHEFCEEEMGKMSTESIALPQKCTKVVIPITTTIYKLTNDMEKIRFIFLLILWEHNPYVPYCYI